MEHCVDGLDRVLKDFQLGLFEIVSEENGLVHFLGRCGVEFQREDLELFVLSVLDDSEGGCLASVGTEMEFDLVRTRLELQLLFLPLERSLAILEYPQHGTYILFEIGIEPVHLLYLFIALNRYPLLRGSVRAAQVQKEVHF